MGVARAVAVAGVLGAGVLVLGACGVTFHQNQYEDDTAIPQQIAKVQVNGSSDIRVHTGAKASVHRVVRYAENDPGKNTWRVQGDTLVLEDCHHSDCSVGYDVVVPAGATITGETGSGDVEIDGLAQVNFQTHSGDATIRNVSGAVNVGASSGTVTISDIGGTVAVSAQSGDVNVSNVTQSVSAKASSGDVQATGIGGPVQVQADSGDIAVRLTAAQNVTAHTGSGGLDVTVPNGPYQVRTDTGSGDVSSDVPNDGGAQHLLDLQSGSGDISVKYA